MRYWSVVFCFGMFGYNCSLLSAGVLSIYFNALTYSNPWLVHVIGFLTGAVFGLAINVAILYAKKETER